VKLFCLTVNYLLTLKVIFNFQKFGMTSHSFRIVYLLSYCDLE
jgi:hypothetical protein